MGKLLIITGATGFTGRFLIEEALSRKYKIVVLARETSDVFAFEKNNIPVYKTDFSESHRITDTLNDIKRKFGVPELIIHNAGNTKSFEKEQYFEVNTSYTATFIDAIKETGMIPTGKFIYTSSLAAVGPGDEITLKPISEDKFPEPVTAYGKSKLAAEKIIINTPELPWIITRPTAIYGPGDKDGLLIFKSISQGFEIYAGNKKQFISFIYVSDFAKAYFHISENSQDKEIFNISDGDNYSLTDYNAILRRSLNKKTFKTVIPIGVIYLTAALNEWNCKRKGRLTIFNKDKINEIKARNWKTNASKLLATGFKPAFSLEKGIKQTINWYKENGWL